MPKREKPIEALNERHELFCLHYTRHHNATRAYVEAGYAPGNASSSACILLQDPLIQARIKELATEQWKRLQMDVDEILARAALIARSDVRGLFDEKGRLLPPDQLDTEAAAAVAGIEVFEEFDGKGKDRVKIGETKKVRLRDPMPAIRLLAEHKKLVKQPDEGLNNLAHALAERMKAAREARKSKEQKR